MAPDTWHYGSTATVNFISSKSKSGLTSNKKREKGKKGKKEKREKEKNRERKKKG